MKSRTGFDFHTIDGERYWDERACYAFTLDQIERQIEAPSAEIDAMCLEIVACAVADESILRRLKIPDAFWPLISESWYRDEASLYGRLDLSFDGRGPAKLLEYNADTPTSILEAAVFQWTWLEQATERHIIPAHADQFNSIHERLIEAWKKVEAGGHLHLAGTTETEEDAARWPISRTRQARPGSPPPCSISRISVGATTAASSIPPAVRSSWRSNSIPGNGCFTMPSATRTRRRSAPPSCASRFIRARGPMSR